MPPSTTFIVACLSTVLFTVPFVNAMTVPLLNGFAGSRSYLPACDVRATMPTVPDDLFSAARVATDGCDTPNVLAIWF